MELIEGLWVALADVYGGRFTRDFGVDPSKGAGTTWARGLAGLNQEQIVAGIEACVAGADGWPPSLPTFRARCLGIPSLAQVKLELRLNGERSGFTVLVWQYIDTHRLETSSAEQGDHLLRETYEFVRQGVMAGQLTVPPPALRLEAEKTDPLPPKEKLAKPETVAEAAIAIDAMFGRHRPAAPDTDSRPATGKMAAAGSDA